MGNFPHTHTQNSMWHKLSFSPSERKNYQEGLLLHMLASCALKIEKQKQRFIDLKVWSNEAAILVIPLLAVEA